jgi:hypothetical protein
MFRVSALPHPLETEVETGAAIDLDAETRTAQPQTAGRTLKPAAGYSIHLVIGPAIRAQRAHSCRAGHPLSRIE